MAEILHQLRLVLFPIIFRDSYIPGGARFQPSTVVVSNIPWTCTHCVWWGGLFWDVGVPLDAAFSHPSGRGSQSFCVCPTSSFLVHVWKPDSFPTLSHGHLTWCIVYSYMEASINFRGSCIEDWGSVDKVQDGKTGGETHKEHPERKLKDKQKINNLNNKTV